MRAAARVEALGALGPLRSRSPGGELEADASASGAGQYLRRARTSALDGVEEGGDRVRGRRRALGAEVALGDAREHVVHGADVGEDGRAQARLRARGRARARAARARARRVDDGLAGARGRCRLDRGRAPGEREVEEGLGRRRVRGGVRAREDVRDEAELDEVPVEVVVVEGVEVDLCSALSVRALTRLGCQDMPGSRRRRRRRRPRRGRHECCGS
jgi:hypothetical protein